MKTTPTRDTRESASGYMEELLLQMAAEGYQMLSESASERFVSARGYNSKGAGECREVQVPDLR